MYPSDVQFFTSRVKNVNPLTIDNLRTMTPSISATILLGSAVIVLALLFYSYQARINAESSATMRSS